MHIQLFMSAEAFNARKVHLISNSSTLEDNIKDGCDKSSNLGFSTCELFRCIFSFYFISAEAFNASEVHVMQIPLLVPWKTTPRTVVSRAATWFFNM